MQIHVSNKPKKPQTILILDETEVEICITLFKWNISLQNCLTKTENGIQNVLILKFLILCLSEVNVPVHFQKHTYLVKLVWLCPCTHPNPKNRSPKCHTHTSPHILLLKEAQWTSRWGNGGEGRVWGRGEWQEEDWKRDSKGRETRAKVSEGDELCVPDATAVKS